jgi:nucleoside-triphosphatase
MTPSRVFLTGDPGCGKTTIVRRICDILVSKGVKTGGMISEETRVGGIRVGFSIEDLMTHEAGVLARVDKSDGPRVGKYSVNLGDLQDVGAAAIRRAMAAADVVIVDELGPMELHSLHFILAVEQALKCPKHFVGTIHKRATHQLVTSIRSNPALPIIEVRLDNREQMPIRIVEQLTGHD